MRELLQKAHMYLGLLSWSILLVYGIAGLTATVRSSSPGPHWTGASERKVSFTVPANQTDKQVADAVWKTLHIPLTSPPPGFVLRRDDQNNLVVPLWTTNGPIDVTVLENQNILRMVTRRKGVWDYLNSLHTITPGSGQDWRIHLWSYYNEFAIWSLLLMAVTGLVLWMTSRPRFWLARITVAVGCFSFFILYLVTR